MRAQTTSDEACPMASDETSEEGNGRGGKRKRIANALEMEDTPNPSHRSYGDTFAAGNAIVHNGDNLHFYQPNSLQNDIQALQQTLSFPGMHQRYASLREAQYGTFDWILRQELKSQYNNDPDPFIKKKQQMRTFRNWYESGRGMFWINGKPGSGKSTMMKYLIEHMELSDMDSSQICPITIHFFFWISGEPLQRSRSGCLKSLIWQLLQNPMSQQVAVPICQSGQKTVWTESQLEIVLIRILRQLSERVVVFIDGVDESDDHEDVLKLLHDIVDVDGVKLCISSRPEQMFEERFSRVSNLKLQDLNGSDIRQYVEQKLVHSSKIAALHVGSKSTATHQNDLHALAQNITWKSEGVFLWVYLVVKDLLKGINNKDSMQTLFQRVDRLPRGIHELYEDMLSRVQDDAALYRDDASLYFALILHRNFNLLEFCFAIDGDLRAKYLDPSIFNPDAIVGTDIACDTIKTWIHVRTAGLLEVRVVPDDDIRFVPEETRNAQISRVFQYGTKYRISFVHRTALDFLRNTAPGRTLLNPSVNTTAKIKDLCFQANLISRLVLPDLQGLGFPSSPASYYHIRIFNCRTCTDEDIFMGIQKHDQILRSSFHYDMLQPTIDHFHERESNLSGMPSRLLTNHSKTCHNTWDLGPYLIFNRRYRAATLWLGHSSFMLDAQYLSSLLGPLMLSFGDTLIHSRDDGGGDPVLERARILDWFVTRGASVHVPILDDSGEVFTAFNDVVMSLRGSRQKMQGLPDVLGIDSTDLATRSSPTCYACHASCLDVSIDPYIWKFLGNFCPADGCSFGFKDDTFLTPHGEKISRLHNDQILLISATSADPDLCPILWAISEEDSHLLIAAFRNGRHNPASEYGMHHQTRWALYNQTCDPHPLIGDVCRRSRVVSFADAMRHMSKSEETIRIVYEKEAKRMVDVPKIRSEVWKNWYWKTSVLPRDQDHVKNDTGYASSWQDLVQETRVEWANCYSWRHTEA